MFLDLFYSLCDSGLVIMHNISKIMVLCSSFLFFLIKSHFFLNESVSSAYCFIFAFYATQRLMLRLLFVCLTSILCHIPVGIVLE